MSKRKNRGKALRWLPPRNEEDYAKAIVALGKLRSTCSDPVVFVCCAQTLGKLIASARNGEQANARESAHAWLDVFADLYCGQERDAA